MVKVAHHLCLVKRQPSLLTVAPGPSIEVGSLCGHIVSSPELVRVVGHVEQRRAAQPPRVCTLDAVPDEYWVAMVYGERELGVGLTQEDWASPGVRVQHGDVLRCEAHDAIVTKHVVHRRCTEDDLRFLMCLFAANNQQTEPHALRRSHVRKEPLV